MSGNSAEPSTPTLDGRLTAFIVRILEQLSLSAWLPAGFLAAAVTLLISFRHNENMNLVEAITGIVENPWGIALIAIPLLLVTTTITQAFSFIAIRTLEGYWRGRGLVNVARSLLIRRQLSRQKRLRKLRKKAIDKAFAVARGKMLLAGWSPGVVLIFEQASLGIDTAPDIKRGMEANIYTEEEKRLLRKVDWRIHCDPWRLARIEALGKEIESYPVRTRLMPTKLGNVLRKTEDSIKSAEGNIQGFVMRNKDRLPQRLQVDHDHYRTRLDMYSLIVFIGVFLSVLSPVMLIGKISDWWAIAATSGFFVAIGVAGYFAAIASAEAYCGILKELDQIIQSS
ncbi:hypothetical protein [Glutamicibacter protophormiae]|uniref:hypothetical protein n=1 Tax=Glutamicibacter protophormiae TaxID=37930 RepID=UPI003A953428